MVLDEKYYEILKKYNSLLKKTILNTLIQLLLIQNFMLLHLVWNHLHLSQNE